MKLKEIVNTLVGMAKSHPNINSTWVGDIYELNHYKDVDYCAFVVTQQEHQVNTDDRYITYHFVLFYVDRLTASEDNRLDVQSAGMSFLNSLIDMLENSGVIVERYTVTNFNERFNDICAGSYADIFLRFPLDDCGVKIN